MGEEDDKLQHDGWKDLREKPRWCTDILFLILIIAAWVIMTIVGFCATGIFKSTDVPAGNPYRLIYPMDYNGKLCGFDDGVKNKKYAYYLPDRSAVCVKSCPTENSFEKFVCRYNLQDSADQNIQNGYINLASYNCMYEIKTKSLVRRCLPDIDVDQARALANATASAYGISVDTAYGTSSNGNSGWYSYFIGDMFSLLGYVFGFGIGVTVGVAFLYLFMLQIKGLLFLMIWGVILGIFVLLIVGSFLLWSLANSWAEDGVHSKPEIVSMRVFAYFGMIVTFLYLCFVIVLRKRIQLAIGIVKQTARALAAMPTLLFLPIIQAVGVTTFLVPWVIYVLCLASSGTMEVHNHTYTYNGQEVSYSSRSFTYTNNTRWAFLYMLFCWFWTSEFIIAIGQLTIALAFALWYFTRDKSTVGPLSVRWAFSTATIYHSGTAAFGSLLIAIVKTIRAVLSYIQKKAKKSRNKVLEYIACILNCIMFCLEKILKFINKNAYIVTAIYGTGFCSSTRKAFFLLLRNILRVAAVNMVSSILLFIGKLFIPIATVFLCYLALAYAYSSGDVTGIISPLVFTFFLSYWVSSMFLEIYGMGIETILICFIADEEMFPVQDRFAEGELGATISKTTQMNAAIEGKVGPDTEAPVAKAEEVPAAQENSPAPANVVAPPAGGAMF